ncbi:P-loop NTPase family protein [Dethiosulfovibrio salsuginis]|uniref:Cobyrinic acid a,c-diamide synthase n=1 Tax=Dethiosulfovibrio salsuginis TaxID=561720 RepID=A0A1X7JQX4_9BACT|nr:hypothetical protein [Dethiosulfovibrio salsuginis]SMG30736.1 cobyrinic acid a,c-diamide synthase [Dethiosulfovibrio salsuginis]
MDFPRLMIADERREDVIPLGIVLAATIRSMGIPLRLFAGGIDDRYLRMLSLGTGQEVFSIDPLQFKSESEVRFFFGSMAKGDCLNLILSPLGVAVAEDRMVINQGTVDLARILDCGVVSMVHANPLASITARVMAGVWERFSKENVDLYGAVFSSVLNPREYQLLEIELGRSIPSMALGYVPRYMERRMISVVDLCSDPRVAQPIVTLGSQLKSMTGQIDWSALMAFGEYRTNLDVPAKSIEPLSGAPAVAIITDDSLSMGIDNDIALFRAIGCRIIPVSLTREIVPPEAKAIYFPHGLGHVALKRLINNRPLFDQVINLPLRGRATLINGGFSSVWGKWYALSEDSMDRVAGLGAFEEGVIVAPHFRGEGVAVDIEPLPGARETLHYEEGEKMRGYLSGFMKSSLGIPGKGLCSWALRESDTKKELGEAIWKIRKTVGSQAKIELWSCPELIKRWIRTETR